MNNNFKYFLLSIVVLIIFGSIIYSRAINSSLDKNGDDIEFIVPTGQSVKQIAKNLESKNIIDSAFWFEIYVWRSKTEKKMQAGTYILNPRYSIKKIVEIFVKGDTVSQERTIKIIEGWNLNDIGNYLEKEGIFKADELHEIAGFPRVDYRYNKGISFPVDYLKDFPLLSDKPFYFGLEGYLFPDTYRIFNDSTIDGIIRKMLANLDSKITDEMRNDIKLQGKTIFEIITMASIIEKEVRSEKDMKNVSGVFWNRIKNGQALESCASLAYITGVNKDQYTIEDTKIDSPYNTYLILGLPPGPIANPGLQAIKAAIYPSETDYNYFLSRPDTGETIFSETYEEHLRNKAKYLN